MKFIDNIIKSQVIETSKEKKFISPIEKPKRKKVEKKDLINYF